MKNEIKTKNLSGLSRLLERKKDFAFVKAVLAGDTDAFEKLVTRHKAKVFALGLSFFKNQVDTDDFVQEVFIKAYTNLKSFKGKSLFSTWLLRIAYNTAFNIITRRKETLPLLDDSIFQSTQDGPEEKQIKDVVIQAVRQAVKELPKKYALCLDMYFFDDIPYSQISLITDLPVNTIKSHIFRAKKILKEKLEALYEN